MKTLNKLLQKPSAYLTICSVILLFILSGCSLNNVDSQNQDISQQDLQVTSQIIGESLSDESSGVMGSLNDAVANINNSGINGSAAKSTSADDDNSGRGSESNFSYSYDPDTGTHTVSFTRSVSRGQFSKNVTDTLKYIFTDNNGNFIAQPRQNRERIETIDFNAVKEGTVNLPNKNSFFVRTDTFLIDGLSSTSPILSIDGVHNGQGNFEGTASNGNQVERNYVLEINFLNIQANKAIIDSTQSLEQGVTGTLTYEIAIERTTGGSSSTKTIAGTIDFNGDGTALLRFEGFQKLFQVNLDNGNIRDGDKEFEGRVTGLNASRNIVELSNGRRVRITNNTEIEFDDGLTSLDDVATALDSGSPVRAEGEGEIRNGNFITSEIEFELDDDSDEDDDEDDGDDDEDGDN